MQVYVEYARSIGQADAEKDAATVQGLRRQIEEEAED